MRPIWDQIYLDNIIYAEEILSKIRRGEDILIYGANIIDDIDISTLSVDNGMLKTIDSNIIIENSNINGAIRFTNVIFNGSIEIKETKLWSSVDFSNTIFNNKSSFAGSKFRRKAIFIETVFEDNADFVSANFFEITSFQSAIFKQDCNFGSTKFRNIVIFDFVKYRDSIFDEAIFCNIAHFRNGNFEGSTRFQNASYFLDAFFNDSKFVRDVSFAGTRFLSNVDFRDVKIQSEADFTNIFIGNKLYLDKCRIRRLNVCWDDIKDHLVENDHVYTVLKKNFRKLNKTQDEDRCYIQYRRWLLETRRKDSLWFVDKAADLSCGYGYEPLKLLIVSGIFICIFSIPYYLCGFAKINYEFFFINSSASFRLSFGPTSEFPMDIYRSLYFSAMTFLGKKAGSFEPPHIVWAFVLLETALGYVALGILISIVYRIFTRGSDR